MSVPSIPDNEDKLAHYREKDGAAFAIAIENDSRIRGKWVNDVYYISLVDFMGVWGEPKETARRTRGQTPNELWKMHKKQLAKRKKELETNYLRLKLVAEDGKLRETDVCDVETAIRILFYMDTPASDEFKDLCARLLAAIHRPEWPYRKHFAAFEASDAASSIHDFLKDIGATYFNGENEKLD
jgi:hypothetical protein